MAFNLKKFAQTKNYDKMLVDQTSKHNIEADENPTNYNGLLESDRVGDSVDKTSTYENLLNEARTEDDDQLIAEKAMDKATGLTSRHDDGEPLMDYHKEGEQEQRKAFNLSEYNKSTGSRTVDKNPGEQIMEKGNKPMTGNVQPSQLLSNYDTRDEFEKAHKMASQKLATADAILYAIYRQAADENRELTDVENQNVETVSQEKAVVLAQFGAMLGQPKTDPRSRLVNELLNHGDRWGFGERDMKHWIDEGLKQFDQHAPQHDNLDFLVDDIMYDLGEKIDAEGEEEERVQNMQAREDRAHDPGPTAEDYNDLGPRPSENYWSQ